MKPYSHSLPHTPWGLDLRVAVLAICMWTPLFASCMLFQRGVDERTALDRPVRADAYGSQECVVTSTRELVACMSAGARSVSRVQAKAEAL